MTKHALFRDFWDVWKYADWSIIFFRIFAIFFKDKSDICQFKDWWKFRLLNWTIKTGMRKICEKFSIILNNSWWKIRILASFWYIQFKNSSLSFILIKTLKSKLRVLFVYFSYGEYAWVISMFCYRFKTGSCLFSANGSQLL